jgi:hypothetical protein
MVNTLYHVAGQNDQVCGDLLEDVRRRGIRFPNFQDIRIPIKSTYTGESLTSGTASSPSLLRLVLDMILIQPVNWELLTRKLSQADYKLKIRIRNYGPGTGLARGLERALGKGAVAVDMTVSRQETQAGIAIVGMAVHLPGARTPDQLWNILEDGINTVSEVGL